MPFKTAEAKRAYGKQFHTKEYQRNYRLTCGGKRQEYERRWRRENPSRRLLANAKQRAKVCGIPFNLELEDIVIPEFCPILGVKLGSVAGGKGQVDNSPSLDKIRTELGYVKGNVAVISMRANVIKNCGTAEEHRKIAEWMDLHQDQGH